MCFLDIVSHIDNVIREVLDSASQQISCIKMHVQFTCTWTTKISRLKVQSQVLGQSAYERIFDQFNQPLTNAYRLPRLLLWSDY